MITIPKDYEKQNLLIYYFLCVHILTCSTQSISFRHLTTDNGLSHNSIISIYQDERGFMWFGTRNGVSLYNGKDFKIYQKEKTTQIVFYTMIFITSQETKTATFIS